MFIPLKHTANIIIKISANIVTIKNILDRWVIKCLWTSIFPRSSEIKKTAVAPPGVEDDIEVGKSKLQNLR